MIELNVKVFRKDMAELEVTINGRTFRETTYLSNIGSLITERNAERIIDQMWTHIGEPDMTDNWEGSSLDMMELLDIVVLEMFKRHDEIVKDFGMPEYEGGQP
jgi:hypothetical protein